MKAPCDPRQGGSNIGRTIDTGLRLGRRRLLPSLNSQHTLIVAKHARQLLGGPAAKLELVSGDGNAVHWRAIAAEEAARGPAVSRMMQTYRNMFVYKSVSCTRTLRYL